MRAHVALEIATSTENEGQIAPAFSSGIYVPDANAAEAARLYEGLLHRSPDASGLAF